MTIPHHGTILAMSKPPTALTLQDHLQRLRTQFPNIRPHQEDDLEWWNDGIDAFNAGDLGRAETIFKKLVLAEPLHFDGFQGLSMVYKTQRQFARAILFSDEAIRLAQAFIDDMSLDPEGLEDLLNHRASLNSAP